MLGESVFRDTKFHAAFEGPLEAIVQAYMNRSRVEHGTLEVIDPPLHGVLPLVSTR